MNETNMVLFDSEGKIKKYKNALDIIDEFATVRLKYYDLRKKYLINKLTMERDLLSNRARFIKMIVEKRLHINNRKKADVVKDLIKNRFQKFGDSKPPRTGFEYLLIMQIASLTKERYEELLRMAKDKAAELEKVKRTSIQQMWTADLDAVERGITELYEKEAAEIEAAGGAAQGKKRAKAAAKPSGGKGRGRGVKRRPAAADEEGAGGDGEGADDDAPAIDPMDNPFSDVARWTAGAIEVPSMGPSMKRRRMK